ncbi:transporter substrate-binding domain-containing protein [Sphaerisporangium krabiense]|uniref:Cystine transport system substrate-binding protein n=1 Tax=Sphaerisporangium krabiense TaxID=763782 RepID=A0A7W8Z1W1_9ACTN|nr:transporter substrate-binding domain-containing protein [Sphaerisporangium krabiense]MBB5625938.1 cystine transport system substrate-binding protein [Sphaerisporangium krabiense]
MSAALTVIMMACLTGVACSGGTGEDTLERVRAAGVLRVALTQANPPWNFLDRDGRPAGYDVDVAREVARRVKAARVEFVGSDYASFIGGIRADRFDIVISGQTITARRGEQVGFSRPYAVNAVSIFVRRGDTAIHGLSDLAGKRIAVSEGTVEAEFARARVPGADLRIYKNATLGLTDLSWGRADAALVSRFLGLHLTAEKGLAIRPAGPILRTDALGMSFRKESTAFKREVDGAVGGMIADGTLSSISRRWFDGLDMAAELRGLAPKLGGTGTQTTGKEE